LFLQKRREELEYLEGMLNNETANPDLIDPGVPLTEQVQLLPYDEKWEVPRENLKLCKNFLCFSKSSQKSSPWPKNERKMS
jgi:hypothetical protein